MENCLAEIRCDKSKNVDKLTLFLFFKFRAILAGRVQCGIIIVVPLQGSIAVLGTRLLKGLVSAASLGSLRESSVV